MSVIKRGKIFQAGDYPTVRFSITPEELRQAVASFSPVPIELEHFDTRRQPSILTGKLGQLTSIAIGADPADLEGEIEIPEWLDDIAGNREIKVSAVWNRGTKRVQGLGLVLDNAIPEAAVFAAFSASQGAPGTATPPTGGTQEDSMSWGERLKGWINGGMQGEPPLPEQPATVTADPVQFASATTQLIPGAVLTTTPDPRVAELERQLQALAAKNESNEAAVFAERAKRIESEAVAFAESELSGHRSFPAEREALIEEYRQAATDDGAHGAVTFAAGQTTSRVEQLRKRHAARPDYSHLTRESLPDDFNAAEAAVLFSQMTTRQSGQPAEPDKARLDHLLSLTELGKAAGRNGSSN